MAILLFFEQSWQEIYKITFIPLLPLLFIFSFLYVFKCFRSSGKPNLPPSPPKLPIIGNLHQLGSLPHRSLQALSNKYGPVMFYFGHAPTLVVSSADMAKETIKTHDILFSNRTKSTATNSLFYGCTDLSFSSYGEYWRQVRKICVLELLSLKRVQSFQYTREEEVSILINKVCDLCLKGVSINLSELLIENSNNIVTRCVFGKTFGEVDGKGKSSELPRKVMVLLAAFFWEDFFPFLGWIDILTGFKPSLKSTCGELDAFLDQVVEEHKTMKKDDDEHPNKKDFADILLQLQKNGMLDFELSHDNLKAILMDMVVGGSDTTSTTLEWVMAELIRNPSIMKRAQEEVRRVVGNKSKIEVNDINQMDYLKCILKESLRLHPPISLSAPRETLESLKFGGYDIPPKTRVFVNVWAIQRDPKLWDRPDEFIPERFKDNPVDFIGQNFEFIPFGGGRRGCPGLTFGIAIVEYVLANLLCWFDWRLPTINAQGEDLDMTEVNALTAFRKNPLYLVPILHSSRSFHL